MNFVVYFFSEDSAITDIKRKLLTTNFYKYFYAVNIKSDNYQDLSICDMSFGIIDDDIFYHDVKLDRYFSYKSILIFDKYSYGSFFKNQDIYDSINRILNRNKIIDTIFI